MLVAVMVDNIDEKRQKMVSAAWTPTCCMMLCAKLLIADSELHEHRGSYCIRNVSNRVSDKPFPLNNDCPIIGTQL